MYLIDRKKLFIATNTNITPGIHDSKDDELELIISRTIRKDSRLLS